MYNIEINVGDFINARIKYSIFRENIKQFLESGVEHGLVNDKLIVKCYMEEKDKLCKLLRYSNVRFMINGKDEYRHLGNFDGKLIIQLKTKDSVVDPKSILDELNKLDISMKQSDWKQAVGNEITLELKAKEEHCQEYNPFRELQDLLDEYNIENEVCML